MKNLFTVVVLYLAISLLACEEMKDEPKTALDDISIYKNVGKQIPIETGIRWMETYNKKNNIQGRLLTANYRISSSNLNAVIQSVDDLVGIAFHHALDDQGVHHFIIVPVEESLMLWADVPGRIYIDANTNNAIDREVARDWAQNYKDLHPDEGWFHFFGSNIFDAITSIPYFSIMNIEPALSDLNFTPQLLLIIKLNPAVGIFGRMKSDQAMVYDASSLCPPCSIQSE